MPSSPSFAFTQLQKDFAITSDTIDTVDESIEIDPLLIVDSDVLDIDEEPEPVLAGEEPEPVLVGALDFGDEENAPNLDFADIYGESTFPFEPEIGFYINEGVGIFLLIASTVYDKVDNNGLHDTFLWYMHLICWGQNSFFWLLTLIFDSALMR